MEYWSDEKNPIPTDSKAQMLRLLSDWLIT